MMQLEFDHVTKFYGAVIGVNDISCRIGSGITGLFGANGAGKSTLIKLASGQLRPSLGQVRVGPYAARSTAARRHIGLSPDLNRFYEEMTGREFVCTMARLHGFSSREAGRRAETVLRSVGMHDRAGRRLAACSHGMRQRIKLAQALVHDPDVLLLDEPLGGIDPGGRYEISRMLLSLGEEGKTILVSTHILEEIEELADQILVIARGRIVASGTLTEIRNLLQDRPFTVRVATESPRRLASLLVEAPLVEAVDLRGETLTVRTRKPTEFFVHLNKLVLKEGIELLHLDSVDTGAEAVFEYLQEGTP